MQQVGFGLFVHAEPHVLRLRPVQLPQLLAVLHREVHLVVKVELSFASGRLKKTSNTVNSHVQYRSAKILPYPCFHTFSPTQPCPIHRPNSHRTRDATRNATKWDQLSQWEYSHCMQATSKEKHSNLRARRVLCELGYRGGTPRMTL